VPTRLCKQSGHEPRIARTPDCHAQGLGYLLIPCPDTLISGVFISLLNCGLSRSAPFWRSAAL